jgi:hypothetical protein
VSRPPTPRPGDVLGDEDGNTFAIVITRGWGEGIIYDIATDFHGMSRDEVGPYVLRRWRFCTAGWREANGIPGDYDSWWAEDGDGASTIDVAVWQSC